MLRWHGAPPLLVCGARHTAAIAEQLAAIDVVPDALIVEPAARNTAPAVALAACRIAARDPDGLMLVMPSDHVIADPVAFAAAVTLATPIASRGALVTFGIEPEGPETGFGYIESGDTIAPGVRAARRFVEKPTRERAEAMLAAGGYTWNAGIFLFRAQALLEALADHAPEVRAAAEAAMAAATHDGPLIHPDAAAFAAAPSISLDYAVMEKAARVAVVPVAMGWSDIGGWDALYDHGPADADGNVRGGPGRVETLDTTDCLLRADGVTLAAVGLSGLNIVATPDAVLVTGRGRGQDVRQIADRLAGSAILERPVIAVHAWGTERLVSDDGVRVRRVDLLAGAVWRPAPGERVMLLAGAADGDGAALMAGGLEMVAELVTAAGAQLLVIGA